MERFEICLVDVIELGSASVHTQGASVIGAIENSAPMIRYLGYGMQAAD